MATRTTVNTCFVGSPKETFLDDLPVISRMSFPTSTVPLLEYLPEQSTDNPSGKIISKVVVFAGGIIDSLRITYQEESSPNPVTVQHGGPGGVEALCFNISAGEKLVAVCGTRFVSPSPWGERHLSQVLRDVCDSLVTKTVTAASGNHPAPTEKFDLCLPLKTASSYTFQPQGAPMPYLEGLGFSNVSCQANCSA